MTIILRSLDDVLNDPMMGRINVIPEIELRIPPLSIDNFPMRCRDHYMQAVGCAHSYAEYPGIVFGWHQGERWYLKDIKTFSSRGIDR